MPDLVTEVGEGLIPTGRLLPVSEVPYNFTSPTRIGDVLDKMPECPGMTMAKGVDFNFCAGRDRETKVIATLYSPKTGRVMDVITDQPGVQCYTGNHLDNDGKDGVHYGPYAGVCLETQHYPDAIHHPHFPSVVLRPPGYLRYPDHLSLWRAVKGGRPWPRSIKRFFPPARC